MNIPFLIKQAATTTGPANGPLPRDIPMHVVVHFI